MAWPPPPGRDDAPRPARKVLILLHYGVGTLWPLDAVLEASQEGDGVAGRQGGETWQARIYLYFTFGTTWVFIYMWE